MYRRFIKRLIDILISLTLLILLALPMLIIAVMVKLDSPGPAIFSQERLGRNGKIFHMYKFRSMCLNAEHTGTGVYSGAGDARVTRIGRILRSTSMDEFPQFWNILRGDMSFIGPRPPLTYHPWPYEQYTPEQRRMFEVRPGITGWAQVHGRRGVEWPNRIRMSVWYVDHMSLWVDLKICFMTVKKVLSNEGNEDATTATIASKENQESGV